MKTNELKINDTVIIHNVTDTFKEFKNKKGKVIGFIPHTTGPDYYVEVQVGSYDLLFDLLQLKKVNK